MGIQYDSARPWSQPSAGRAQVGLTLLCDYLVDNYGGSNNGIFNDRAMRGSGSPSLHRDGRALDWTCVDTAARRRAFNFLIEKAEKLQIQRIHFYEDGRSWHCDGSGIHRVSSTSDGWNQAWADWLHIERNWQGATDDRPIDKIIGAQNNDFLEVLAAISDDPILVGQDRPRGVVLTAWLLAILGYHFRMKEGKYTRSMSEAVTLFQKRNQLAPTGKVTIATIVKMFDRIKERQQPPRSQ